MTGPDGQYARLESLLGAASVLAPASAAEFTVSGRGPAVAAVLPGSVEEVQEIVRFCADQRLTVLPSGAGTMMNRGARPNSYDVALSTKRLTRITDYQPENLVFASEPGITGAGVAAALAEHRQVLTLDPPLFAASTLGGIAAARASGPARFQYGTPRDLVIGLTVVDAAGNLVKSGGKVVKSVSGYDLCKLYTGSMGTLGVIVETIYRLSPMPEESCAVVMGVDRWESADVITARILDSVLQPRCIEVLNAAAAVRLAHGHGHQCPVTVVVCFDGSVEQVDYQCREASAIAEQAGASEVAELDMQWNSPAHQRLADLEASGAAGTLYVVRGLSSDIPFIWERIERVFREKSRSPLVAASAGNGVLRVLCEDCDADGSRELMLALREATSEIRGVIVNWFSPAGGSHEEVWGRSIPGIEVMRGIKSKLDPDGVFVSGRFAGGI